MKLKGETMKKENLERIFHNHKNLIVEGPVSSGKTTNLFYPIVEEIVAKKESLFILDSKEEYINRYSMKLKSLGYNTVIINLRDLNKSEGWNPIQYPYFLYREGNKDKALEYIEKIGKTIFKVSPSADPFWSNCASSLFIGIVLGLFEDAKEEEINLSSVNAIFNGINMRMGTTDYLTAYFKSKNPASQSLVYAASTIYAPNETKGSILSVARQPINLFITRIALAQLLSKTTFSFEKVANRPTAIFFVARDDSDYLSTLPELFIEQLYSILVDLKISEKFHFVLDNFDVMKGCNELINMLSSCLSRNMKFYLSTRSIDNLEMKYGNYLIKLCDIVRIQNDSVEFILDDNKETFEKQFVTIPLEQSNVEYPKLKEEEVKVFDFLSFVDGGCQQKVEVGDFIRRIDAKVDELEQEEKFRNQKSVLEQFKFDE